MRAKEAGVPVISCMGSRQQIRTPRSSMWRISTKDYHVPFGEGHAQRTQKRGVKKLKVVYSTESPVKPLENMENSCKTGCGLPSGYHS